MYQNDKSSYPADVQELSKEALHSQQAEQSVLGGLMLDNTAWTKVSKWLIADDFHTTNHQSIFTAIASLVKDGAPVDIVTVSNALKNLHGQNNLSYLGTLARDTPSAVNIEAYAKIVYDKSFKRKITKAINAGDFNQAEKLFKDKAHIKSTFNSVLDQTETVKTIDLLEFIDDNHLLKKLSIDIANCFHLPENTVFLMGLGVFSSVSCRKFFVNYPDNKKKIVAAGFICHCRTTKRCR